MSLLGFPCFFVLILKKFFEYACALRKDLTYYEIVLTECLDLLENDDSNGDEAGGPTGAVNNSSSSNLGRPPP